MEIERIGSFKEEHDFEDAGCGSYTHYAVLRFRSASTDQIGEYVRQHYPSERCQHEWDCCGNYYPSSARYHVIEWDEDTSITEVLVKQSYYQNV